MKVLGCILLAIALGACASATSDKLDGAVGDGASDAPRDAPGVDACVPTPELCNNLDDDCDGKIDETFAMLGITCQVGMGACQASGHNVCATDHLSTTCDARAGSPTPETCDNVDDDCDGLTDEGFGVGMMCDGPDADLCKEGMIMCDGLGGAVCSDMTADNPELCNNIDDDCDGSTDEGLGLGVACDGPDTDLCKEGVNVCDGVGGVTCSDATGNSVEICNGFDDDCNGTIDDGFPVGQACTVGVGACARTGQYMCNGPGDAVLCSATPGAATPEVCGDGIDQDCSGADVTCPGNDLPAGAIDISAGGTFTADLSAAHDDNLGSCGLSGGRDVFYKFTLPAAEVVYADTFGSSFDSVVRIYAGSCTALGAEQACYDDPSECTGLRQSQGALQLAAGSYCLVVDQYSSSETTGATTLRFLRGGRPGTAIASASGSVTGSNVGKTNLSVASCESRTPAPDVGYFFLSCPAQTFTVGASTCSTTTNFDTVIYMRNGAATTADIACSDDSATCTTNGLQSVITGATVTGPDLHWIIVDGFTLSTGGTGTYKLTYTIN
jgi:hypothetical protein